MAIINTYHTSWPSQIKGANLLAVLTGGAVYEARQEIEGSGDCAVYVAIVALDPESADYEAEREKAAHWVFSYGLKLTYREALRYFPNLPEDSYRL